MFKITFACDCGGEHDGLVTHDELDWAPLAGSDSTFLNLMTARVESAARRAARPRRAADPVGRVAVELLLLPGGATAARHARPPSGSSRTAEDELGLAVECPTCAHTSVNVVSREHVDVPFYNDRRVGVVEHIFVRDRERALAAFRDELFSGAFDAGRRDLAA